MAGKVLKKIVFNRKKWITNKLSDQCDNFCALGFLDYALHGNAPAYDGIGYNRLYEAGYDSNWQMEVYTVNDRWTRQGREPRLQQLFKEKGIDLDFADDLPGPVEAVFEDPEPVAKLPKALTLADLESESSENKTETTGGRKQVIGQ